MELIYTTIFILGILSLLFVARAEMCEDDSRKQSQLRGFAVLCGSLGYLGILGAAWQVTPPHVPLEALLGFLLPSILGLTIYVARNPRPKNSRLRY